MKQFTGYLTSRGGATFEYDSLVIITLVEEDGELKVVEYKDFTNPRKRSNFIETLLNEGQIA